MPIISRTTTQRVLGAPVLLIPMGWFFLNAWNNDAQGNQDTEAVISEPTAFIVEKPDIYTRSKEWLSDLFSRANLVAKNIEPPQTETFSNPVADEPIPTALPFAPVMGDMSRVMYAISDDAYPYMERFSSIYRVPVSIAANVIGSESGFKNDAVSSTGALGIAQTVTATRLEELYRSREHYPADIHQAILDNILEYNSADPGERAVLRHRIRDGGSQKAVDDLAKITEVGVGTAFSHMNMIIGEGTEQFLRKVNLLIDTKKQREGSSERLATMEKFMRDKIMIAADVKIFYLCGVGGGSDLLAALADPVKREKHSAADYAPPGVIAGNREQFYKPNGSARNLVEFYNKMIGLVGDEPVPVNLLPARPAPDRELLAYTAPDIG